MSVWKLTVRHGPDVSRDEFDDLGDAVAALRRRVEQVRSEGPLKEVSALRDFEPVDQVRARLEISGRGILRPPTAGVDVRGDGSLVAFAGSLRRRRLKPGDGETAFDAVRAELDESR